MTYAQIVIAPKEQYLNLASDTTKLQTELLADGGGPTVATESALKGASPKWGDVCQLHCGAGHEDRFDERYSSSARRILDKDSVRPIRMLTDGS